MKPTYKPGWDLPGGMAESNEAPDAAARRELMEELGLDVTLRGLLVVDWVPPHGPWDDQLAFIFDGGTVGDEEAARLTPHDEELAEIRFMAADSAAHLLRPRLNHRLRAAENAIRLASTAYLNDGNSPC